MNIITLLGRLTADPKTEATQNKKVKANFTLAVDRRGAKEGYQQTDFIPCRAWNKTAEFLSMYMKKGQRIALRGRLIIDQYKDKMGNNKTFAYVLADEVYFADGKKETNKDEIEEINFNI